MEGAALLKLNTIFIPLGKWVKKSEDKEKD